MAELRFLTLHGDRVAYRDEGAGDETLLLVHGIAGSSLMWERVMPYLTTSYRVLAPDLLGNGASDKPRADYSLSGFAVWLRDFLDALEVPAVNVVGHSLGGGVAMQLVYQHRRHCRRLVLINSGGLGGEVGMLLRILSAPGAGLLLPIIGSQWPGRLAQRLLARRASRGVDPAPESADQGERSDGKGGGATDSAWGSSQSRRAFLRTLRAVVDTRGQTASALNKLDSVVAVPTLFIAGAQDRIIPAAHAREAHVAVAGSRLHIIDDAGHEIPLERPDVLAKLIRDFVGENAS